MPKVAVGNDRDICWVTKAIQLPVRSMTEWSIFNHFVGYDQPCPIFPRTVWLEVNGSSFDPKTTVTICNDSLSLSIPDNYWWQQTNPSLLAAAAAASRGGLGYSPSLHIPAESSYTYPSIITPAHMDTPGSVLPHYAIEKCGYGYMTSSYGHLKQTDMMNGQEIGYKGAPRRKKTWSRAVFTSLQRRGLEKRFEVQKYVNKPDRKQLASALGLTDSQVSTFYVVVYVQST